MLPNNQFNFSGYNKYKFLAFMLIAEAFVFSVAFNRNMEGF